MELPLESPSSANENGPRNRMNINIPDKTRPPPEMMARGYMQDEDDSEGNSASELEGESLMMANSMVTFYGMVFIILTNIL
jgi:son of sevenless-like protein